MADSFGILGQSNPSATTLTTLFTGTTQTVASLIICNRSATPTAVRVSLAIAGAGDDPSQYILYDCPIAGNQTLPPLGFNFGATDVVRVYATLATIIRPGRSQRRSPAIRSISQCCHRRRNYRVSNGFGWRFKNPAHAGGTIVRIA